MLVNVTFCGLPNDPPFGLNVGVAHVNVNAELVATELFVIPDFTPSAFTEHDALMLIDEPAFTLEDAVVGVLPLVV